MFVLALGLCACGGGKSGGSASGSESGSSASGLKDGQWPAAVYDKYGIPEIETKGKIVYKGRRPERHSQREGGEDVG